MVGSRQTWLRDWGSIMGASEGSLGKVIRLSRHVVSEAGVSKYGKPIGSLISDTGDMAKLGHGAKVTTWNWSGPATSAERVTHWTKNGDKWDAAGKPSRSHGDFSSDVANSGTHVLYGHITPTKKPGAKKAVPAKKAPAKAPAKASTYAKPTGATISATSEIGRMGQGSKITTQNVNLGMSGKEKSSPVHWTKDGDLWHAAGKDSRAHGDFADEVKGSGSQVMHGHVPTGPTKKAATKTAPKTAPKKATAASSPDQMSDGELSAAEEKLKTAWRGMGSGTSDKHKGVTDQLSKVQAEKRKRQAAKFSASGSEETVSLSLLERFVRTPEGAAKFNQPIGSRITNVSTLTSMPVGSHITTVRRPTNRFSHGNPIHWRKGPGDTWIASHGGLETSSTMFNTDINDPDSKVLVGKVTRERLPDQLGNPVAHEMAKIQSHFFPEGTPIGSASELKTLPAGAHVTTISESGSLHWVKRPDGSWVTKNGGAVAGDAELANYLGPDHKLVYGHIADDSHKFKVINRELVHLRAVDNQYKALNASTDPKDQAMADYIISARNHGTPDAEISDKIGEYLSASKVPKYTAHYPGQEGLRQGPPRYTPHFPGQ